MAPEVTPERLGKMLLDQRNRMGLSQAEVGRTLNYPNINFISMIEKGKAKIPVGRIIDFTNAYQFPTEFSIVIMKALYPECLDVLFNVVNRVPKVFKAAVANCDEEVERITKNY